MATDTEYAAARRSAYGARSYAEREAAHDEIAAKKADVLAARAELGRAYLEANPSDIVVPYERACASVELIDETRAAREEAVALNAGRSTDVNNVALEFPVLGHEFAAAGPVIALGTEPLLLAPVVRYCGMIPILFNVFVTRAHQTEVVAHSPHQFHVDPEDTISFKLFVHLTDVDEDCGPFHALPAELSRQVFDAVDYRGVTSIEDERVDELVGFDKVFRLLGPAGTVGLADTTRCLHFGARPRVEGKPLREMIVYHYLLPTSIAFGPNGVDPRKFLAQLAPTADATWDALIGATLV
jgi:hypothetical protein